VRYFLIIPAVILDLCQFLIYWAFVALQAATPVGGGIAGAAVGAKVCYDAAGGVISGVVEAAKCAFVGATAGALGSAIAMPLAMIIDTTLSITIGGALIMFLAFEGMFYFDVIFPSFMGEALPLVNFLPFWTILTYRCIARKNAEAAKMPRQSGVMRTAFSFVTGKMDAGGFKDKVGALATRRYQNAATLLAPQEKQDNRAPGTLKSFDGIRRPANHSAPKLPYVQVA
jgi:hypothetical protein